MIDYDQPDDDPVVAEVRQAREQYAARFNFGLRAIFDNLRRHAQDELRTGETAASLPPRRPPGWVEQAKRAG